MHKKIENLVNTATIVFCFLTLSVHLCTFLHFNFNNFKYLSLIFIAVGFILSVFIIRNDYNENQSQEQYGENNSFSQLYYTIPPLLIVLFFICLNNFYLFWIFSFIFLAISYFLHRNVQSKIKFEYFSSRTHMLILSCIIISLCFITTITHRPDPDDANLLNIVSTCLDYPDKPLHSVESIHGIKDLPIQMQVRRILTYEPLIALTSNILNIYPHSIYYHLFPLISVCFHVLIFYLLYSLIFKENWIFILIIMEIILLSMGQIHRSYGNFAFVRIFQGKSVFITVLIPLVIYYALRFSHSERKIKYFILLSAAQISAIGFTVTALWAAPLTSGLTLISSWNPTKKQTITLFSGLFTSLYVIILALYLKTLMFSQLSIIQNLPSSEFQDYILKVLGSGPILWIQLFSLIGSWSLIQKTEIRRFFLSYSFFYLLFCLNPFLMDLYKKFITGPSPYWRMLWLIPMPTLLAITFTSPILIKYNFKLNLFKKLVITTLAITIIFTLFGIPSTLSPDNKTTIHWPTYKMNEDDLALSRDILRTVDSESFILAPLSVSYIIATFPAHPPLIAVRSDYLDYLSPWIKKEEYLLRKGVFEYISGYHRTESSTSSLIRLINSYNIEIIVVPSDNTWVQEINDLIRNYKYDQIENNNYFVWKKRSEK